MPSLLKNPSVNPNYFDENGYTALHWFVYKPCPNHHQLALKCLQSGRNFNINAKDRSGNSPLHIAAMVSLLLLLRINFSMIEE